MVQSPQVSCSARAPFPGPDARKRRSEGTLLFGAKEHPGHRIITVSILARGTPSQAKMPLRRAAAEQTRSWRYFRTVVCALPRAVVGVSMAFEEGDSPLRWGKHRVPFEREGRSRRAATLRAALRGDGQRSSSGRPAALAIAWAAGADGGRLGNGQAQLLDIVVICRSGQRANPDGTVGGANR